MSPHDLAKDLDNLRKLSYFYYFSEAVNALILIAAVGYIAVTGFLYYLGGASLAVSLISGGPVEMANSLLDKALGAGPLFAGTVAVGSIFAIFAIAGVLFGHYTGKFQREQKHHTFCFVMAILTATSVPIGTAIGVPTIILLLREPVKKAFSDGDSVQSPPLDSGNLGLLSNLFVLYGLLSVAVSLISVLYVIAGVYGLTGNAGSTEQGSWFWPAQIIFSSLILVLSIGLSVCTILAGQFLKRKKAFVFCIITSVLISLFAPFGTILGIWSLFVLFSDPGRAAFRNNA
ncbi:MAG: hypothetical protein OEM82_04600 [Acidobacteriota bacterium]|nr:hypothetical protein [Acidobacteriota bacterium]MDH3530919.1 hypothetical protein [Acidobacteriota bacterium]